MSIRTLCAALSLSLLAASPAAASPTDGWLSFGKRTRYGNVSSHGDTNFQWGSRGQSYQRTADSRSRYGRSYDRGHRHGSSCRATPGYWDQVRRDVWVPGTRRQVWVEPVYETFYDSCGTPRRRLVRAGCWEWITEGGCFEPRYEKVWRPASYACSSIVRR